MSRLLGLLITAAGLAAGWAAQAARAPLAVLEAFEGEVRVWRRGHAADRQAKPAEALASGDEVRVLEGARARLALGGVSLLLRESSFFGVAGPARRPLLSFFMGEFLVGGEGVEALSLRLPAAVVTASGGPFALWVRSEADNSAEVACLAGSATLWAQEKTIVLYPGQQARVEYGQAPGGAQPSGFDGVNGPPRFAVGGSLGALEGLLKSPALPPVSASAASR